MYCAPLGLAYANRPERAPGARPRALGAHARRRPLPDRGHRRHARRRGARPRRARRRRRPGRAVRRRGPRGRRGARVPRRGGRRLARDRRARSGLLPVHGRRRLPGAPPPRRRRDRAPARRLARRRHRHQRRGGRCLARRPRRRERAARTLARTSPRRRGDPRRGRGARPARRHPLTRTANPTACPWVQGDRREGAGDLAAQVRRVANSACYGPADMGDRERIRPGTCRGGRDLRHRRVPHDPRAPGRRIAPMRRTPSAILVGTASCSGSLTSTRISSRGSRRKVGCAPAASWKRHGDQVGILHGGRDPPGTAHPRDARPARRPSGLQACGRCTVSCRWPTSRSEKRGQRASVRAARSGSPRSCWPRGSGCSGSRSRCD